MKLTNMIFGISTKNLELVELVKLKSRDIRFDTLNLDDLYMEFDPPKYILAKNKNGVYKDVILNDKYNDVKNYSNSCDILGKRVLEKVSLHKRRIKYKDADRYVKEMNGLVLKGKK